MHTKDEAAPKNTIIRYGKVSGDARIGPEDTPHIELITSHVERHIGPVSRVIHETSSKFVHVDLLHVEPTPRRNFNVPVTSRMSDRPMQAPPRAPGCRYAELSLCLPPEWPLQNADFNDKRHYWPIQLLQTLARVPHAFRSWLWAFHSVPNFDPPSPIQATHGCDAMLVPSLRLPREFAQLEIAAGRQIAFFDVLPLHADEMAFKVKNGAAALLDYFDKSGHKGLIDPARPSVLNNR